jgi:cytochrome c peroxidase
VVTGFKLHRWGQDGYSTYGAPAIVRADAIAEFLRKGLVPPPREERALNAEEQRGRALFQDPNVGCATCHVPNDGEYTNRAAAGLGVWPVAKLELDEERHGWLFKTPGLRDVGGTPPYYHDGSAATLEDLIERNGKRMGHTEQLSKEDRAALVAFLKTL